MSTDFTPDWDSIRKAQFFAELAYKSPSERQTILESSSYGNQYYVDDELQTDEFVTIASYEEGGEVYHSYRGSVNRADFITDSYLAVGNLLDTDRFTSNETLSMQARTRYQGPVTHVGHSLGGTIADQMARRNNEQSVSFNQGSTPVHNYGEASRQHQQIRIDNDFVSSFTKGPTVNITHQKSGVEKFISEHSRSGVIERSHLGIASRIVSGFQSHFNSNFRGFFKTISPSSN